MFLRTLVLLLASQNAAAAIRGGRKLGLLQSDDFEDNDFEDYKRQQEIEDALEDRKLLEEVQELFELQKEHRFLNIQADSLKRRLELDPSEYDAYVPPPPGCAATGVLLNETFQVTESASIDSYAALGSLVEHYSDSGSTGIRVKERTNSRHGIEMDLKNVRSCLENDNTYIFTARVRLVKDGAAPNTLTDCAASGTNCLKLVSEYMNSVREIKVDDKYIEKQSHQTTFNDWWTISTQFEFWNNELKLDHIYHTLRLEGAAEGVTMEVDNIVLRSPPSTVFRQDPNVCQDLVPGNGGADEMGDSPYPFYPNYDFINIGIESEGSNPYFAITGRKYAWYDENHTEDLHWTSMAFDFPVGCAREGTLYNFTMKVRVHPNADSPSPGPLTVYIKGYHNDNTTSRTFTQVAACPVSTGDWVNCEGEYQFAGDILSFDPQRYQVYFQTKNHPTVDYDVDDIEFSQFDLGPGACDSLVRNGDAEASATDTVFWFDRSGGIEVVPGAGINGSNAFADTEQSSTTDAIAQYLDTRCLVVGETYEIKAWVKLIEASTNTTYFCNAQQEACPRVGLFMKSLDATGQTEVPSTLPEVAGLTWQYAGGQYQLLHGVLDITQEIADALSVLFYIERNRLGFEMYVDNISVELMSNSTCEEIVHNGHFSSGTAMHWQEYNGEVYAVVDGADGPGDYALSTFDGSASQYVRNECMQAGTVYEVTLTYKLKDNNGQDFVCTTKCPKVGMTTGEDYKVVAREAGFPGADGWSKMYGMFTATELDADPNSQVKILFTKLIMDTEIIIDRVSIKEKPKDCSGELTLNSDMELGYLGFWINYGSGDFSLYPHAGGNAVRLSNRQDHTHGMEYEGRYFMDFRCIESGREYDIIADFKLLNQGTDTPASCNITDTALGEACPSVRLFITDASDPSKYTWKRRFYNGAYQSEWDPSSFNRFHKTITIPAQINEAIKVLFLIRDFNAQYDLLVDNFKVIASEAVTSSPSQIQTATPLTPSPTAAPLTPSPTAAPLTPSPTAAPLTPSPTAAPLTPSPTATSLTPSPTTTSLTPSPTTTSLMPSPTATPLTPSPTGSSTIGIPLPENVCPEVGETLDVVDPTKKFAVYDDLCTLTKVTTDYFGEVLAVVPVARSYNGNDWESAAGGFAAAEFADTTFDCTEGKCTIPLPPLQPDEKFVLSSFAYVAAVEDERARFIEMATFGTTREDLENWNAPNDASWIRNQVDLPATSLRAYWRQWTNSRWQFSQRVARSTHPCDPYSRWRRFVFTRKDTWVPDIPPSGHVYVKPLGSGSGSPHMLYTDGHARTVVHGFEWNEASVQNKYPTWDPDFAYKICRKPSEWTGGNFFLETVDGGCQRITSNIGNPAVDFTGYESYMGNNVFYATNADQLTVIENWKDRGDTKNDDMYVLEGALSGDLCDSLPEQTEDLDAPVFMVHSTHGYLQFDPRIKFEENTVESPLSDGGGAVEISTAGETRCMNAPRTFLNSKGCVLSTEPTACGSMTTPDISIELNSANILQLHALTGRYSYAMDGLKVKKDSWQAPHPCTAQYTSRWVKKTTTCNPTPLGSQTSQVLSMLLSKSKDPNPYVRDIFFKLGHTCDAGDTDSEIEIQVGADCWEHVHPEHMSVWDLTYWTQETTHPGNSYAESQGHPHPIKKFLDNGDHILTYPSTHPGGFDHDMSRWETHHLKFDYVGRFGDFVSYRDLPNELRLEQVVDYYGTPSGADGNAVVVCGSPGESANDPTKGSDFDLSSIVARDTLYRGYLEQQRETVWTMVALYEKDQLRQRMAWALSQIFAIAKSAIAVHERSTECFLHYYDIFVRNAFGNFLDILREVSFSPIMAENLSFLESRSSAYVREKENRIEFADENFAREIMQLFTTGLILLNLDGTPKLDADNNTQQVYTNADIRSISRVWTGFDNQEYRGGLEAHDRRNRVDPMRIDEEWRDKFPKSDLYDGFIGDGYPLCVDLPERQFLRKGSKYRLLGSSPLPELMTDQSQYTMRFVLGTGSSLYSKLCEKTKGKCTFPMEVTLDANLPCNALECEVDTVRVVEVADSGLFYEYIQPPCVEHSFFDNAMKLNLKKDDDKAICGNPLLPSATSACCETPDSYTDAITDNRYHIERMTFATQDARCQLLGRQSCEYDRVDQDEPWYLHQVYHWAFTPCSIQVKVDPVGEVAIVHDMPVAGSKVLHVSEDTMNYFQVPWEGGSYPKQAGSNCGSCQVIDGESCLCDTSVVESVEFTSLPSSAKAISDRLHIGAPDPSSFDGKYTSSPGNGFTVYKSGSGYAADTIFEVTDGVGRTQFLKNAKSTVNVQGGFSFRNPVQFMSLIPSEANIRDAFYETEALLEHLLYHDNTAPFLCVRFIQRFGISNPSPRYVKECSMAFRSGEYVSDGVSFGAKKYGDLEATAAAIMLDREARAVVLDVDPSSGSLREPLIRSLSLMRSMSFQPKPDTLPMVVFDEMKDKCGQMAFEQDSVFNFYISEFVPDGPVSSASLVAPEAQLLDMPKIVDLINGMHSTIKYGLSSCGYGFGDDLEDAVGGCNDDGSYNLATGTLTYSPPAGATAEEVVNQLCTLLTSGRLDYESRQVIIAAYEDAVNQADTAAGVRIASQLITTSGEYHTTNTVKFSGKPRPEDTVSVPAPGQGYKAVVMLMFAGGCDSFNMLVPKDCSPQGGTDAYEKYAQARAPVELLKETLKPIDADGQVGCSTFGVHEKLPILKKLYDENDLLFFANTGVLGKPSTKETHMDDTPVQIFAHNTMQRQVRIVDLFDQAVGTGILGRLANALSFKGLSVGSTSVDGSSSALIGKPGASPPPISISNQGVNRFMPDDAATMTKSSMIQAIETLNNDTNADSGFMSSTWSSSLVRSLSQNEELYNTLVNAQVNDNFGSSEAGKKLKIVSKLIKTRAGRGVNTDLFYVQVDGWDHHTGLEDGLSSLFQDVNEALTAFSDEMKAQNIWNNVTLVEVSDFARSLSANTGGGTDHAWGGQYFMAGGSVKGKQILGEYPADMSSASPINLGRGRFLPTTGWDEIWPAVASWAGVDNPDHLDMICPNRNNFPAPFTTGDLFA